MANVNGLQLTYWNQQQARVSKMIEKIKARPFTKEGIVFPDPDANSPLAIGEGRRLKAAVMFIDICGFSSISMENAEEQDLMLKVLSLFFSEMIRIGEDYGGNIEKNTGDGLLLYFKDDKSTGVSAVQQAVSCSLTMLAANEYLINPVVEASRALKISFRVAIDYGTITVARIGAERRFGSFIAIGTTANLASKILKHAEHNGIVLGNNAVDKLPVEWKKFTTKLDVQSGWKYVASQSPYPIFKYSGRWSRLT